MKLNLEEKVAERIVFADSGKPIEIGSPYFVREEHGREARYTTIEAEKMLGLREFDSSARKKATKSGASLPDGSFPILNCSDAKNARRAIGRANPSDRSKVRAHIRRREKILGCQGGPIG